MGRHRHRRQQQAENHESNVNPGNHGSHLMLDLKRLPEFLLDHFREKPALN
jgi:hypothetical protein